MSFRYPLKEKIVFYGKYFLQKVFRLWFEVERPRLKMFIYEMLYSAKKLIDYGSLYPSPFGTELVATRFGAFRIRPHTADMSTVSPAFERRDIDYLLELLRRLKDENKKILFLDIGADIGTYSVTVGNAFKDYGGLRIMAFEPADSNYALLVENIGLNGLEGKAEALNFALFSEDDKNLGFQFEPEAPGNSSLSAGGTETVLTKTLDSALSGRLEHYHSVVAKLDVEGAETEVLKGAKGVLGSGKDIYLLVEDFLNSQVVRHLEGLGAQFLCKLTPYNSWWWTCAPKVGQSYPLAL